MEISKVNLININQIPKRNNFTSQGLVINSNIQFTGDVFVKEKKELTNGQKEASKVTKTEKLKKAGFENEKVILEYGSRLNDKKIEQAITLKKAGFSDEETILTYGSKLKDHEVAQATKLKKAGFKDEKIILRDGSKLTDEEIELVAVIKKNRLFFSHESDILNALIR